MEAALMSVIDVASPRTNSKKFNLIDFLKRS